MCDESFVCHVGGSDEDESSTSDPEGDDGAVNGAEVAEDGFEVGEGFAHPLEGGYDRDERWAWREFGLGG